MNPDHVGRIISAIRAAQSHGIGLDVASLARVSGLCRTTTHAIVRQLLRDGRLVRQPNWRVVDPNG